MSRGSYPDEGMPSILGVTIRQDFIQFVEILGIVTVLFGAWLTLQANRASDKPRACGVSGLRSWVGRARPGTRSVFGIEVKASSAPTVDVARHVAWLRDQLGDTFVAGVTAPHRVQQRTPWARSCRCPDLHAVVVKLTLSRTSPPALLPV